MPYDFGFNSALNGEGFDRPPHYCQASLDYRIAYALGYSMGKEIRARLEVL